MTGPHGGGGAGPEGSAEEETVASVAALYLGNILYAIELAALSLDRVES